MEGGKEGGRAGGREDGSNCNRTPTIPSNAKSSKGTPGIGVSLHLLAYRGKTSYLRLQRLQ